MSVGGLSGLVEILQAGGGSADIADLASDISLAVDSLLPLDDACQLLGFVDLNEGGVALTPTGAMFARADIQASKQIFGEASLGRVPPVRTIRKALERSKTARSARPSSSTSCDPYFSPDETRVQLDIAIDWGRYTELFEYDAQTDEIGLPDHPLTGESSTS